MSSAELERIEAELKAVRALLEGRSEAPQVVSLERAAELLAVSQRTVRRMVADQQLLVVKVGSIPKVPMSELRRVTTPRPSMAPAERPSAAASKALAQVRRSKPPRAAVSAAQGEAAAIRAALKARKRQR